MARVTHLIEQSRIEIFPIWISHMYMEVSNLLGSMVQHLARSGCFGLFHSVYVEDLCHNL
jgi:hypothetical protein